MPVQLPPITQPRFRFRRGALEPPGLYVDDGDFLALRIVALTDTFTVNETVEGRVRLLGPRLIVEDVRLRATFAPNSPTTQTIIHPLTQGMLEGAMITAQREDGSESTFFAFPGVCYCELSIGRGGSPSGYEHTLLAAGYLGRRSSLGWPGGAPVAAGQGTGMPRTITLTNPAAGADYASSTVYSSQTRLQSASFVLTTDATVAARDVRIRIQDGLGNVVFFAGSNVTQPASTVLRYTASPTGLAGTFGTNQVLLPYPNDLLGFGGLEFHTATLNLQAGDQFSAFAALVERWAV